MSGNFHAHGSDQRGAPGYRPDIDGLRAIAVLAVVGGHIGLGGLGGGFTGVDMFFVISGYLVGGAVVRDMTAGRLSLRSFYARRLRRIAPALLVMLVGTTLLMLAVALPDTALDFAHSMIASLACAANLHFYATDRSYFAGPSAYAPLLPLWSLAVEEQYYLLFPLFVVAVRRYAPRLLLAAIVLGAVTSLTVSVLQVHFAPLAAFYLLPARAWELLIGALAAGISLRLLARRAARECAAIGGLAMSLLPFLLYRSATPFPGLAALMPCIGTALLLVSGAHGPTQVGRLLATKPLIFFGLISYSLYLWHWPLLLAVELALPTPLPSITARAGIFVAAVLAGYLSWRFVERPTRASSFPMPRLIRWIIAAAGLLLVVAAALLLSGGLAQRFAPATVRLASKPARPDFHAGGCFANGWNGFSSFNSAGCLQPRAGRSNILLIGDSHAAQYAEGLAQTLGPNVHLLRATASGCAPFLSLPTNSPLLCSDMSRFLFERYLPPHPVDKVIIGGAWTRSDLPRLAQTLDWLRAHRFRVVLIGPGMKYSLPLPTLLALGSERGDRSLPERFRVRDQMSLDRVVAALAVTRGISYFSPYRVLCPQERCVEATPDGRAILYDQTHLSRAGAALVMRHFSPELLLGPVARPH